MVTLLGYGFSLPDFNPRLNARGNPNLRAGLPDLGSETAGVIESQPISKDFDL